MSKLHYLTVQDVLWINLQVTKKVQHFSYARLEEATYYQYAYGETRDLIGQAARFLSGFVRMRPLDAGNEATAFVAAITFLGINGVDVSLEDAHGADWFRRASASIESAREALESVVRESESHHHHDVKPDIRAAIRKVLGYYPTATTDLTSAAAT